MDKEQISDQKTYLVVPFDDKDRAVKAAGKLRDGSNAITFDGDEKLWYAKPGADLSKVREYLPDPAKVNTTTAENDPRIEFARTLEGAGFVLDGLPEMNGRRHRVRTLDDKQGQKTGVYVGYLDGIPAGWYQDHRIHSDPVKWKASGQKLDQEAQTHLRAMSLQRLAERQAEQERAYGHNAHRAAQVYNRMPAARPDQGYLQSKGVKPFPGTRMDKRGRLVLPLNNAQGEIRTLQRIDHTGFKSLKKNGQKTGNFFVVGDQALQNGEPILYAEGYSTSASIAEATGRPVVMTVDAGNMPRVAEILKAEYPDSKHFFLGDDDRTNEVNKGREKAEEAAALTGGVVQVPEFTEQEQQQGLTDFNDLHQSRGLASVRDQVEQVVANQPYKVETMSKETDKRTDDPVISQEFDQYISQGLETEPEQAPRRFELISHENQTVYQTDDIRDAFARQTLDQNQNKEYTIRDNARRETASSFGVQEQENAPPARVVRVSPAFMAEYNAEVTQEQRIQETVPLDDRTHDRAAELVQEIDLAQQTRQEAEQEPENTIEPHIEQSADRDARQWVQGNQQGNQRQTAQQILDNSSEARREREETERLTRENQSAFNAAPANQQWGPAEQTSPEDRPALPDRVAKSYVEVNGKFYFAGRPDSLAFVDKGARLQTKLSNTKVAESMVDIAESRGWTEIQVKGTQDFRREAWLEAAARGLEVRGYSPREEDLARLKQKAEKRQSNEIEAREQADHPRSAGKPGAKRQAKQSTREPNQNTGSIDTQKAQANEAEAPNPLNRLAGTLVEHGKAPYEHNSENRESYYVTLENADGQTSTTWGVDLERAMDESGAQKGDTVELENQGRQPVQVSRPVKDEQGNTIRTEQINTNRNQWQVKAEAIQDKERDAKDLVREHPDLVNEVAAIKVAEKFSSQLNGSDREKFMDRVRSQIAGSVSRGEATPEVHVREEHVTQKEKDSER